MVVLCFNGKFCCFKVMKKICIKLIKLYNVEGRVNIYLKLDISEIIILIYGMILNFIIVKIKLMIYD